MFVCHSAFPSVYRLLLLGLGFGMTTMALATPPAYPTTKESKSDRLRDEKLDSLEQIPKCACSRTNKSRTTATRRAGR